VDDEIGGQCGQLIVMTLRPAVLDRHVFSFDVAGCAQSLAECGQPLCKQAGRRAGEKADHWHRLLLRAQRTRRGQRATQEEEQLATFHSITSSARSHGAVLLPVPVFIPRPRHHLAQSNPGRDEGKQRYETSDTSATEADRARRSRSCGEALS
jgi:hypothetical protein